MPNFEISETTLVKSVTIFIHPSIFWLRRGPLGPKVTGLGGGVHQPHLAICKILSHSDNPSLRYLLPNFVDFVAGMTHKTTKPQETVNNMSLHYTQQQLFKLVITLCWLVTRKRTGTSFGSVCLDDIQHHVVNVGIFVTAY